MACTSRDACGWPDWSASCSPPPILVVLALVVAWDSGLTLGMAVLWGGIAALFASVLPYALILRGVRQGRLTDKNISLREQRDPVRGRGHHLDPARAGGAGGVRRLC